MERTQVWQSGNLDSGLNSATGYVSFTCQCRGRCVSRCLELCLSRCRSRVRRVQGEVGRMVGEGSTLTTEFSEKRFFSVWTHMCLMPTQNHLRGLEQWSATYVLVLLEPWRRQKLETGGCLLLELQ